MDNIDIEKLRKHIYEFYQSAYFASLQSNNMFYSSAVMSEMVEIETCSVDRLLKIADDMNVNLDDFKVKIK